MEYVLQTLHAASSVTCAATGNFLASSSPLEQLVVARCSSVEIWERADQHDPAAGMSMRHSCAVFGNVELCLAVPEHSSGRDLLFFATAEHSWVLLRWNPAGDRFQTAASGEFQPAHGDAYPDAVLRPERADGALGIVEHCPDAEYPRILVCIWDGLFNALNFQVDGMGAVRVEQQQLVWPLGCGRQGSDCLVLDIQFVLPTEVSAELLRQGESHIAVLYLDAGGARMLLRGTLPVH